ncbi:hypothetical protein [Rhizobium rhizogenes]|uniref:hypothetical protein n=1 Tax=Rhizobium rhizogenes TaxID=359 RepID=UPI001F3CE364|nr:hypothetical protein [Rhizobium rhizogenes]
MQQIHAGTVWNRRRSASASAASRKRLFAAIVGYCGAQGGGSLGQTEVVLTGRNGERHLFEFETLFNRHEALTLGHWLKPHTEAVPARRY